MAVHTELSEANINKILKNYQLGELIKFTGIKEGIENTNYLIRTKNKNFIITIFEKRVDIKHIPFYFEVMTNSHSKGIHCPVPIKDKNGEFVNKVKNKKMAIFRFLEGDSKKKWSEDDCFMVGQKLAQFHLANINNKLKAKNNFSLNFWKKIYLNCLNKFNTVIPNSLNVISDEIDFISFNWPKNLPEGVIHADLFPDNVFFKEQKISGFLDFYFSCCDFLSYDLAITINAWCFYRYKFKEDFFLSLISGYQSVRKLETIEVNNINILLRGASLRFLFTRVYDSLNSYEGEFLKKKDPLEFFNILKFHIKVDLAKKYFE